MGWAHAPAIYTPEHVAGWKPIVEKVHEAGGVIFCQLWHMVITFPYSILL